jgi:histidyl-tRNA synthetase
LRGQGLRVEVFPEASKLGKQLQYADGAGMQDGFAAILAPDEQLAGELTLKRLSTGHQERVPIDAVAAAIARMRTHDNAGAGG